MTKRVEMTLGLVLLAGCAIAQVPPPSSTHRSKPLGTPTTNHFQGEKSRETEQIEAPTKRPEEVTPPAVSVFRNGKEKLSYALGVNLATGLKYQQIDVEPELIVRGFRDALSAEDKMLMNAKDLAETLKSFQADRRRGIEHSRQMLAEKNKKETSDFVAENAGKDGVVTLPSGLQYKVLKQGEGKTPSLADTVVCNYRGTLLDGEEFDSSYKHNQPATVPVKGLIKGWSEALQLMPVGSKWQIFVPPHLGYGERVVGDIGPNSTLVFEIELLAVQDHAQRVNEKVASQPQGNL